MTIQLLNENVLATDADAILLPIDGQARGLGGSVAQAFARKWPEAYEQAESRLQIPVPLGNAVCVKTDANCRWGAAIFLTTLNHLETLGETERLTIMNSAFLKALSIGVAAEFGSMSSVILQGGWRVPPQLALSRMVNTYENSEFGRQKRHLNICCLDSRAYKSMVTSVALSGAEPTASNNAASIGQSPD